MENKTDELGAKDEWEVKEGGFVFLLTREEVLAIKHGLSFLMAQSLEHRDHYKPLRKRFESVLELKDEK